MMRFTRLLHQSRGGVVAAFATKAPAQQTRAAAARSSLVFDGVTVVDVERGALVPAQRVVVVGNRIQAVGGADAVPRPPGAQVVDAQGKYLIPGLWDMHIHPNWFAPGLFYPLLVANGVTGIRDPGSIVPLATQVRWRREILAGKLVGPPRQIFSGLFINGGYVDGLDLSVSQGPCIAGVVYSPSHFCITSAADAQYLVDSLKAAGTDMIKAYTLSRPMYFALAAAARRAGLPLGGHLHRWVSLVEASDSGMRIVDHSTSLPDLQSFNYELQAHCAYEEDGVASVTACRPLAERLRRNGTWWVPTATNEPVAYTWKGNAGLLALGPAFRAGTLAAVTGHWLRAAPEDSLSRRLGQLRIAQQVGVPIMAGTDADYDWLYTHMPGFSLHAELALLAVKGLTPLTALQTATLNPAKFLHGTDSLGTVTAGKLADLVLLDADPLVDITNTTKIRAVVANGRYYDRAALDRLLGAARLPANIKQWKLCQLKICPPEAFAMENQVKERKHKKR